MRKGPLSKKDKHFIDDHMSMDANALAQELDRSLTSVEKYIEENHTSQKSSTHSLFVRKPDRGVTVMTEAASMAGDESKKNPPTTPGRYTTIIHKIKD